MSTSINQESLESVVNSVYGKTSPMFFPNDFVLKDAKFCAKLVNYAYQQFDQWKSKSYPKKDKFHWEVPSDIPHSRLLWGNAKMKGFSHWEPFGFVYYDGHGNAYISLRGTLTKADDRNDVFFNLVKYKLVKDPDFGYVHCGFYIIYESLSSSIIEALEAANRVVPISKIYFTGHSLGAGLCTLAMPDVVYNFASTTTPQPQKFLLYNFASPRLGDSQFAYSMNNSLSNSQLYRIVNSEDIVTTLPLSTGFLYEHIGQQITFTTQYFSVLANHSMANCYTYAIEHPDQPQNETPSTALEDEDKPVLVTSKALAENLKVSVADAALSATETSNF